MTSGAVNVGLTELTFESCIPAVLDQVYSILSPSASLDALPSSVTVSPSFTVCAGPALATGEIDPVPEGGPRNKWEFSVDVVNRWERTLFNAATPDTRRIAMRLSMVFGTGAGGVFEAFRNITRFGLGGTQGPGTQYVSWLHVEDLLRMLDWCLDHGELSGSVNMCSPNPMPNSDFMRALREAYGVKLGLPATTRMLAIGAFFMRTETELLLKSRRVVPGKLLKSGFKFNHPTWPEAAKEIERSWRD